MRPLSGDKKLYKLSDWCRSEDPAAGRSYAWLRGLSKPVLSLFTGRTGDPSDRGWVQVVRFGSRG